MGHVKKQTYTKPDKKTGKRVTRMSTKWYIYYADAKGKPVKEAAYTD